MLLKSINRIRMMCLCILLCTGNFASASSLETFIKDAGMQQPEVHQLAPDFLLQDMHGRSVSLKGLRGEWVLLHFWATWCIPCRHEMPRLYALDNMGMNGLRIVCINVDRGGKNTAQAFMDKVTPHFHTLLDPEGRVRNHYAIRALPTTYLINPQGKIMGRMIGERDWTSPIMTGMLKAWLALHTNR